DFGLSPRRLEVRLRRCGLTWDAVHAVVLTHPHSDHWRSTGLRHFAELGLPIYCHREHHPHLDQESRAFQTLADAGRFRDYEPGQPLDLRPNLRCLPIALSHDGPMTCGFRFDGDGWSLGYLADLGSWTADLAGLLADVDLLALEFNH